jgi:hypothetical protein
MLGSHLFPGVASCEQPARRTGRRMVWDNEVLASALHGKIFLEKFYKFPQLSDKSIVDIPAINL